MKTDRELLELAAKAAGISGMYVTDFRADDYYYQGNTEGIYYELPDGGGRIWNPLTADGDAFRLAVRLRMCIEPWGAGASAVVSINNRALVAEPHYGDDPERATRRAIVRVAAAIGEQLP